MDLQLHQHSDTQMDPSCSLPKLQPTFSIGLGPQKPWFQKRPESAETQVAVFGQACGRTGGGVLYLVEKTVSLLNDCPVHYSGKHATKQLKLPPPPSLIDLGYERPSFFTM